MCPTCTSWPQTRCEFETVSMSNCLAIPHRAYRLIILASIWWGSLFQQPRLKVSKKAPRSNLIEKIDLRFIIKCQSHDALIGIIEKSLISPGVESNWSPHEQYLRGADLPSIEALTDLWASIMKSWSPDKFRIITVKADPRFKCRFAVLASNSWQVRRYGLRLKYLNCVPRYNFTKVHSSDIMLSTAFRNFSLASL